jgi:cell surface protein SprA
MYVHAEGFYPHNKEMCLFIRLGSDFSKNYYEYEVPLYPTKYHTNDPDSIWDPRNQIDILEKGLHVARDYKYFMYYDMGNAYYVNG